MLALAWTGPTLNEAARAPARLDGLVFSSGGGGSQATLAPAMRVTEQRPLRPIVLDVRSLRRSQPLPSAPDDPPFGALIGALIGILASVPLWALIGIAVLLLRRG